MMTETTIILADDHPMIRQGLRNVLSLEPSLRIVGETGDGNEALRLIVETQPDIAVLDISMPSMTGLDIVKKILSNDSFPTEVVILTMYKEEAYFTEAMDLGVKGYLLKDSAPNEIVSCIRTVSDGRSYVSPLMSHYLVKRTVFPRHQRAPSLADLTNQERRVMKLLVHNLTSREIADELHVSIRTVQHHRSNICAKLGLEGYNKLLLFAFEHKDQL